MSTIAVNQITDASGGATATINTFTPTASNMAGRNKIIGGDFTTNPWQRGTSFTALADNAYCADRFYVRHAGSFVADVLRTADAPTATASGVGASYCLHVDVTTGAAVGANDRYFIRQTLEGYNTESLGNGESGTRYFTVSFWVKSTITGIYSLAFQGVDRLYIAEYTVSVADTWEKKEVTVPCATDGTWNAGNTAGMTATWYLAGGSTYYNTTGSWLSTSSAYCSANQVNALSNAANNFKIALVQLEVGSVATPFETRLYGQELALCQRYYQKFGAGVGNYYPFGSGAWYSSTYAEITIALKVTMRTSPTGNASAANTFSINGGVTVTPTSINPVNRITPDTADVSFSAASGGVAGYGMIVHANNVTTAFLEYSAEL